MQNALQLRIEPVFDHGRCPARQILTQNLPLRALFQVELAYSGVLAWCEWLGVDCGVELVDVTLTDLLAGSTPKPLRNNPIRHFQRPIVTLQLRDNS